jgi:plastocyanin
MRSVLILTTVLAAAVSASRCSGGGSTDTPTGPGSNTPSAITISIVGTRGNASYQPNPVPKASGEQVMFRNNDTVAHRIVMDDSSVDFGNLAPGASSQASAVATGNFHCTTHPSMVGSINGATAPEPPPGSGDGY